MLVSACVMACVGCTASTSTSSQQQRPRVGKDASTEDEEDESNESKDDVMGYSLNAPATPEGDDEVRSAGVRNELHLSTAQVGKYNAESEGKSSSGRKLAKKARPFWELRSKKVSVAASTRRPPAAPRSLSHSPTLPPFPLLTGEERATNDVEGQSKGGGCGGGVQV